MTPNEQLLGDLVYIRKRLIDGTPDQLIKAHAVLSRLIEKCRAIEDKTNPEIKEERQKWQKQQ